MLWGKISDWCKVSWVSIPAWSILPVEPNWRVMILWNSVCGWQYIYFFFHHTMCEITCDTLLSSAANQGDNTVSVAQGSTATPGTTKQLLLSDRVFKRIIYICTYARSIKSRDYIGRSSSYFMWSWWYFKNVFTSRHWCHNTFTVTVSWCCVITWEWWFRMHFIHTENFSLSTKSNLMHIVLWSEDDLRPLSNCIYIYIYFFCMCTFIDSTHMKLLSPSKLSPLAAMHLLYRSNNFWKSSCVSVSSVVS